MKTVKFLNLDCVPLKNDSIEVLVTQSVGPRIISLKLNDGNNLLAELPDLKITSLDNTPYSLYGGHRLWHAPEEMSRTYIPDDNPVEITIRKNGLLAAQEIEPGTGLQKSLQVHLVENKPQVIIHHTLTNRGFWAVEFAPWAITMLKKGGIAILPQARTDTGLLPNRSLAIWPYTDINCPQVSWGNSYLLVQTDMEKAFKIGYPNPRGWLAYWLENTLFVKRATYSLRAEYYDFGSSSECYCNGDFLELETVGPIEVIEPGESATHIETWELYQDIDRPENEAAVQSIVDKLDLD